MSTPHKFQEVIGGNYRAAKQKNGTWTIYDVPLFAELPAGARQNTEPIGVKWMEMAVSAASEHFKNGHIAPLHINHHSMVGKTARAGFVMPRRVGLANIKGKLTMAIFGDLMGIEDEIFDQIKKLRLPYRSPEVANWQKPEIASLALLADESPFFKFPMLSVQVEGKADPTKVEMSESPACVAMCDAGVGGSILFNMSIQAVNKKMADYTVSQRFGAWVPLVDGKIPGGKNGPHGDGYATKNEAQAVLERIKTGKTKPVNKKMSSAGDAARKKIAKKSHYKQKHAQIEDRLRAVIKKYGNDITDWPPDAQDLLEEAGRISREILKMSEEDNAEMDKEKADEMRDPWEGEVTARDKIKAVREKNLPLIYEWIGGKHIPKEEGSKLLRRAKTGGKMAEHEFTYDGEEGDKSEAASDEMMEDGSESEDAQKMTHRMNSVEHILAKIAKKLGIGDDDNDDNDNMGEDEAKPAEQAMPQMNEGIAAQFGELHGRLSKMETEYEKRCRQDRVTGLIDAALAELTGYHLSEQTEITIAKMAEAGSEVLNTFVENFKQNTPMDGPESFSAYEARAGEVPDTSGQEAVYKFSANASPAEAEAIREDYAKWHELNGRGMTSLDVEKFLEIQRDTRQRQLAFESGR